MMTQCEAVLDYMTKNGGITAMEAYEIGITRISARIFDLRRQGYEIAEENHAVKTRYGRTAHYVRYYLKRKEQKEC